LVTADLKTKKVIKTNASNKTIKTCLNQLKKNKRLYSIAYYSRKMTNPELNYNIYNKELLAIIEIFK